MAHVGNRIGRLPLGAEVGQVRITMSSRPWSKRSKQAGGRPAKMRWRN